MMMICMSHGICCHCDQNAAVLITHRLEEDTLEEGYKEMVVAF